MIVTIQLDEGVVSALAQQTKVPQDVILTRMFEQVSKAALESSYLTAEHVLALMPETMEGSLIGMMDYEQLQELLDDDKPARETMIDNFSQNFSNLLPDMREKILKMFVTPPSDFLNLLLKEAMKNQQSEDEPTQPNPEDEVYEQMLDILRGKVYEPFTYSELATEYREIYGHNPMPAMRFFTRVKEEQGIEIESGSPNSYVAVGH